MAYLLIGPVSTVEAKELQRLLRDGSVVTRRLRNSDPALLQLLASLEPAPITPKSSLLEHFAGQPRLLSALSRARIPVQTWNLQQLVDWLASYDNDDGKQRRGRRVPENIIGIGPNLGPILRRTIKKQLGVAYPPERLHTRGYLYYRPPRP